MEQDGEAEAGAAADTTDVLQGCLVKFGSPDFIMEPEIFSQLKKYFQAGGNPEQVIDLLSSNYVAVAQMANLMAEWLILAGAEIQTVQQLVENHLHDMILKTFDPKKADAIFAELACGAYRVPNLAVPYLPAGRGLSRLPHAQLHHQTHFRRRLSGRNYQHQHGGPTDRSFL